MQELTLAQVRRKAAEAKSLLFKKAIGAEHDTIKIYLHWSAGWYTSVFEDYHINIGKNGEIWPMVDDFSDTLSHTWWRNSGSIAVSLCCCVDATTEDLGENPPTEAQIETMAKVIAALCDGLGLEISKKTVMTHGEAADNIDGDYNAYDEEDCYGVLHDCTRWDLQFLGTPESPVFIDNYDDPRTGGNVLRGKAQWYRERGYE